MATDQRSDTELERAIRHVELARVHEDWTPEQEEMLQQAQGLLAACNLASAVHNRRPSPYEARETTETTDTEA